MQPPLGVLCRTDRAVGHVQPQHRAQPGELHGEPVPASDPVWPLAQAIARGTGVLGRVVLGQPDKQAKSRRGAKGARVATYADSI